jgi:hypothetical protein
MKEIWPNLFIVGASKSGTSSLYAYLNQIPEIFMSKIKEPNYFSIKVIPNNHPLKPIRDKKKYLNLFNKVTNEKIIGESSPTYLIDSEAPKLIHEVSPHAKIIIIIRDPVERTFSQYLMGIRLGKIKLPFHELINKELKEKQNNNSQLRLETGLYSKYIKLYKNIFGENQVKIIIFEEFIKDVEGTVQKVLDFLGIQVKFENMNPQVYNAFGVVRGPLSQHILTNRKLRKLAELTIPLSARRVLRENIILKKQTKPKMKDKERGLLIDYYREDVKEVQSILKRPIPWPNFYS